MTSGCKDSSVLGPGLLLLRQYVEGKYHNGAYFHSQHATVNPMCHHQPPLSPLSENVVKGNSDGK